MLKGHGGDIYGLARQLGCRPEDILDFSSNCSPLPFPDGFKEFITSHLHQLHWLPEVDSASIRELLSEEYGLSADSFLLGSGTTEWIFSIPALSGLKRTLIPEPTYADYRDAAELAGMEVMPVSIFREEKGFSSTELLKELACADLAESLIFLCNPNNPTGLFIPPEELLSLIQKFDSALFVVDESYAQFIGPDEETSLLGISDGRLPENLLLLRSFSKIYGIPGLRVGCLVSTGPMLEGLKKKARPWAVNRMAQLALDFLFRRPEVVEETRRFCQNEKKRLINAICQIKNLAPLQAGTHYFLIRVKGKGAASKLAAKLRRRGILVRDCSNFKGLEPKYIRISPSTKERNDKLIKELKALEPLQDL